MTRVERLRTFYRVTQSLDGLKKARVQVDVLATGKYVYSLSDWSHSCYDPECAEVNEKAIEQLEQASNI